MYFPRTYFVLRVEIINGLYHNQLKLWYMDVDFEQPIKRKVLDELKEIRNTEPFSPQNDWDLIWVLSGPQETFEEEGEKGWNETRERLETGFELVKKVTAVRMDKKDSSMVTTDDIRVYGPKIFFNGWRHQDEDIERIRDSGIFEEKYKIPSENITFAKDERIDNTPDQFKWFPQDLIEKSRKIVLVTDAYYLPRAKRISQRQLIDNISNPLPGDKLIFIPSATLRFPLGASRSEIRKTNLNFKRVLTA